MRPFIDNPDYIGPWSPKQIENPDYFEDDAPLASVAPIGAVAVEVWAMDGGIVIDNILVSTDEAHAREANEAHWQPKIEKERAEQAHKAALANKVSHMEFWRELISKVDPFVPEAQAPQWHALKEYVLFSTLPHLIAPPFSLSVSFVFGE